MFSRVIRTIFFFLPSSKPAIVSKRKEIATKRSIIRPIVRWLLPLLAKYLNISFPFHSRESKRIRVSLCLRASFGYRRNNEIANDFSTLIQSSSSMEQTSRKKLAYFASEYSDEGVNRSSDRKEGYLEAKRKVKRRFLVKLVSRRVHASGKLASR